MAISVDAAARFICEKSGWQMSNIKLQKILYLAHMMHIGRENEPLISGEFQAWDYGPVHPDLYHKVKSFGAKPISEDFFATKEKIEGKHKQTLEDACEHLLEATAAQLVANTHWEGGAWAETYSPKQKNLTIPYESIADEYRKR